MSVDDVTRWTYTKEGIHDLREEKMIAVMLSGFFTGLILQVAIGPVFFFILNTAMQKTLTDGWLAIVAVTIVDYLFIALAILGVGKLLEKNRIKLVSGIVGSLVLVLFGILMTVAVDRGSMPGGSGIPAQSTPVASFVSAFVLTASSPLTIVFWTSLFATKAIEKGYDRGQLIVFGLAAGSATPAFLGSSVTLLAAISASIPPALLTILNIGVGLLLIVYGMVRLRKMVIDARAHRETPTIA